MSVTVPMKAMVGPNSTTRRNYGGEGKRGKQARGDQRATSNADLLRTSRVSSFPCIQKEKKTRNLLAVPSFLAGTETGCYQSPDQSESQRSSSRPGEVVGMDVLLPVEERSFDRVSGYVVPPGKNRVSRAASFVGRKIKPWVGVCEAGSVSI